MKVVLRLRDGDFATQAKWDTMCRDLLLPEKGDQYAEVHLTVEAVESFQA